MVKFHSRKMLILGMFFAWMSRRRTNRRRPPAKGTQQRASDMTIANIGVSSHSARLDQLREAMFKADAEDAFLQASSPIELSALRTVESQFVGTSIAQQAAD